MSYKNKKHKLRYLWDKIQNNEIDIVNLKKLNIRFISANYFKGLSKINFEWTSWKDLPNNNITVIELIDFPEDFLSYINVNLMIKTTDGFLLKLLDFASIYLEAYGQTWIEEYFNFSYILKAYKEFETDTEFKYYLIIYANPQFWEFDEEWNYYEYPLEPIDKFV